MLRTTVIVTHRQVGFHRWPEAPAEADYLRHPHRHQFLMVAAVRVDHDDRHVEFHALQRQVAARYGALPVDFGAQSCEHLAKDLLAWLTDHGHLLAWVEVWEDEENGARVEVSE